MSHSPLQTTSRAAPTRSAAPILAARTSLVQRKCACGGKAGMDSECEECRRKRLAGTPALPIQTKLTVGPVDDRYEREADRVASTIMRMPNSDMRAAPSQSDEPLRLLRLTPLAQRQLETDDKLEDDEEKAQTKPLTLESIRRQADTTVEEDDEEMAQTKPASGAAFCAPAPAADHLAALRSSGGNAMPHADRSFFEPRFGHDFGAVRIHTGPRAAAAARTLHARAFTAGRDIVFGSGQYSPGSNAGRNLMAHELAHVVQQRQAAPHTAASAPVQRKAETARPGDGALPPAAELTSGGAPLAKPARSFYEARFGRDLAGVRVHTGPEAALHSRSLQAHAFAYRNHIWLGAGNRPEPSYALSHELAHVVQQEQPAPISAAAQPAMHTQPSVQRFPFWIPIANNGTLFTGTAIHNAILGAAEGSNGITTEVGIPNGVANAAGLGLVGRADLYNATSPIGVFFDRASGQEIGQRYGDNLHRNPAALRGAGGAAQPRMRRGRITNTATAPTSIQLGELKPADRKTLQMGHEQLGFYQEGIEFARDQVNQWAGENNSPAWALSNSGITRLNVDPPEQFIYNPNAELANQRLALVDFSERTVVNNGRERDVFTRTPLIRPEIDLGMPIRGGLYAEHFGQGLWMYYARPQQASLAQALNVPGLQQDQDVQGAIALAQQIQDDVVGNLMRGPETIRFLPLNRNPKSPGAAPIRVTPDRSRATLRRAPQQRARLQDPFNYTAWARRQEQLGDLVRGKGSATVGRGKAGDSTQKGLKKLEFLHLASEAEEGLTKVPGVKQSKFPKKGDLTATLHSTSGGKGGSKSGGKGSSTGGGTKVPHQHSLFDLYSWMEIWTGAPVRNVLGRLRGTFGTTFITVATWVRNLRSKFHKKLADGYDTLSKGKSSGTSYVAIAVRAIGRALRVIAKLLLPPTFRLLVESLGEGLRNKLQEFFPLDLTALREAAESGFQWFASIGSLISRLKDQAMTYVNGVLSTFGGYLAKIKEVIDLATDIANTIKWAIRAIQCGTPPAWGCIKLLFSSLTRWLIDKVISDCRVHRKIAGLALKLDFITSLPAKIAGFVGEKINDLLPSSLSPIFAEIGPVPMPSTSEIGCDGEFDPETLEIELMRDKLVEKYGETGAQQIMDAFAVLTKKSGLGEDDKFTADQIRELSKKLIESDILPLEIEEYAKQFPKVKDPEIEARLATVQEFLDDVRKNSPLNPQQPSGAGGPEKQPPADAAGGTGAGGTETGGAGGGGDGGGAGGPGNPVAVPLEKLPDNLKSVTFYPTVLSGSYEAEGKLSRYPGPPVQVTLQIKISGKYPVVVPNVEAKIVSRNFLPSQQKAEKIVVEVSLTKKHPFEVKLVVPSEASGGKPTEYVTPFTIGPGGKIKHEFPMPPK